MGFHLVQEARTRRVNKSHKSPWSGSESPSPAVLDKWLQQHPPHPFLTQITSSLPQIVEENHIQGSIISVFIFISGLS